MSLRFKSPARLCNRVYVWYGASCCLLTQVWEPKRPHPRLYLLSTVCYLYLYKCCCLYVLYLSVFPALHLCSPHPIFPFIKSLEWPSEAVCPVWYVRNSAEQPWKGRRGRRVKEEDEGGGIFQISCPRKSEGKGKCGWKRRSVRETLKRQGNDCLLEKMHFFFLLCETNRLTTWPVECLSLKCLTKIG